MKRKKKNQPHHCRKTSLQWEVFYRNAWNTNSVSWQDWNSSRCHRVSEPDRAVVPSTHPPWDIGTEWPPEKGKPGSLSILPLQQVPISPLWDLWELCASPQWAQPLRAQCLCPGLCCHPECWPRISASPNNSWGRNALQPSLCAEFSPTDRNEMLQTFRLVLWCCLCWWHRLVCCSEWLQPKHGNKIKEIALKLLWISLLSTRQKRHCSAMCTQLSTCVMLSTVHRANP